MNSSGKKITFVAHGPNQMNGPNIWLQRITPALLKRGWYPEVVFFKNSDKECRVERELVRSGVRCHTLTRLPYTEDNVLQLLNLLSNNPPDVFVPNLCVPAYFASKWIKMAGIPTLGILHSDDTFHHQLAETFIHGSDDDKLSGVICVSKYIEQDVWSKGTTSTEIFHCPYGVDLPQEKSHFDGTSLSLVYTGRLIQRQKRIFDLIAALRNTIQKVPDTAAVLFGEDREGGRAIAAINEAGLDSRLRYGGLLEVQEILPALIEHHVFVLLSDYEGISISLMEAMSCGLVPICTRTKSGATEIIEDNVNGLLVDDRENGFQGAVERLHKEEGLWKRLSSNARSTIEKGYTIDVCADRFSGILEALIESGGSRRPVIIPNYDSLRLPDIEEKENGISREDTRRPKNIPAVSFSTPKGVDVMIDAKQAKFLAPSLTPENIDLFLVRSKILKALKEAIPSFTGSFLDIGCGEMPYRDLILKSGKVTKYIGMDIQNPVYQESKKPDLFWDGKSIPLPNSSIDSAMATEVFEHVPDLSSTLREIRRVLKPNGTLFFTVPFLWPLHDAPYDECRYTPFFLERTFKASGFSQVKLEATGGWNASLAQMLGLWLKRAPMPAEVRSDLTAQLFPFYQQLVQSDQIPNAFSNQVMLTGLSGTAS